MSMSQPTYGAAWDDLRVPLSSIKRLGFTDPDWVQFKDNGAASTGVYVLGFDGAGAQDEEVFFAAQIPHTWREGTAIEPHVHWCPSDGSSGNVRWGLEYTVQSVNGTFGNTTIIYVNDAADETAYKHQIADLGSISMAGHTISAMLICRLFREATDAADTYNNQDALLLEFDFHFQVSTPGSRQETVK